MGFLTVFLTVLKIIGFVIAGLLGLIIVLLLIVLLTPVCYKGRIKYDGKIDISIRMQYLFGIVRAYFIKNENGQKMDAKVLWFSLLNRKEKKKKLKPKKQKKQKKASRKSQKSDKGKTEYDGTELAESEPIKNGDAVSETSAEPFTADGYAEKENPEALPDKDGQAAKKSILQRLKDIYNNIKRKFLEIKAKIKELLNKKDWILGEINDKDNREAVTFALKIVRKLLKHVLPRKHRIYVKFGMDDPATTGEILGAAYAMGALIGLNLVIEPDFEHKVIECDIPFKGHVCLLRVLIWGIQMYRNKKFRKLLDKLSR